MPEDKRRIELIWLTGAALTGLLASDNFEIQIQSPAEIGRMAVDYARHAYRQIHECEKEGV